VSAGDGRPLRRRPGPGTCPAGVAAM